jgi:ectoine hydroxylase-related dioxygenase (phytanoyl-CoA dioxygenase family)
MIHKEEDPRYPPSLLGKDAILYELSCMMRDPNSQRQVVHPDTPHKEEAVLYTCFVALQDISIDMGPTTWLPRTHTQEMHERFQDESSRKVGSSI